MSEYSEPEPELEFELETTSFEFYEQEDLQTPYTKSRVDFCEICEVELTNKDIQNNEENNYNKVCCSKCIDYVNKYSK